MNERNERELRQVRLLLQQRRFRAALDILGPLRVKHPDDFDVAYMHGVSLALAGDMVAAVDAYCHAVTLQPGHVDAHNAMGLALAGNGEYDRSLEYFEWSLHLDPTNIEARRARGGVLLQLGRDEEAFNTWEKLGVAAEGMIEVVFGMAQIHENRGDLAKAGEYYRKVLLLPGDSTTHELARLGLTRIAEKTMRAAGELRMDVVMYCLLALQRFTGMERTKLHVILLEIGLAGRRGLNVNDPTRKYYLRSMPGSFTGLQLVSYLYTGFKVMGEVMDVGMDLSKEYEVALGLWEKEKKG